MFTFVDEGGILLSNDAFGQHVCAAGRFDTDLPEFVLMSAAQKFYANLITPVSQLVVKKMGTFNNVGYSIRYA